MSKPIIQLNEESVKSELKELVRNSLVRMKNNIGNNNEWDIVSDISSANMYNINRAATDSSIDSRDIVELRKKLLCN